MPTQASNKAGFFGTITDVIGLTSQAVRLVKVVYGVLETPCTAL